MSLLAAPNRLTVRNRQPMTSANTHVSAPKPTNNLRPTDRSTMWRPNVRCVLPSASIEVAIDGDLLGPDGDRQAQIAVAGHGNVVAVVNVGGPNADVLHQRGRDL